MGHEVAAFKIPLPSIEEQDTIAAAATNLELKMEIHQAKHEQLHALFKTLLDELMAVKTRVNDIQFPTHALQEA
jgi:restriction endonuclease S subunit